MKRALILFLTITLSLALAACGFAETKTDPETWYSQARGMDCLLAFSADNTYAFTVGGETKTGTWAEQDGGIVLDGDEAAPLYRVEDRLLWPDMELFFTNDPSIFSGYAPAALLVDDVPAELFNGYWKSAFVDAEGVILPAWELNDVTDVYIEAPCAALGGPLFGDVIVDMTFADGALVWSEDDVSVTLQLQQDSLMCMTLSAPDGDMTLYLMLQQAAGISPENAE